MHDKYLMKGKNLWYLLYFKTFSLPFSSLAEDPYFRCTCEYWYHCWHHGNTELLRLDLILYAVIAMQRKEHRYKDSQKLDGQINTIANLQSGPSLIARMWDGTDDTNSKAFYSKPYSRKEKAPVSLSQCNSFCKVVSVRVSTRKVYTGIC